MSIRTLEAPGLARPAVEPRPVEGDPPSPAVAHPVEAVSRSAARVQPLVDLFLISFVALFFEMIAIRWLASEVRVFAYLKNLPLLASFLGMGLGCALAGRRRLFVLFPLLLPVFSGLVAFAEPLGLVHLTFPVMDELRVWNTANWRETLPAGMAALRFYALVLGAFLLVVALFVGLGERMGAHFEGLPPLHAYSSNLAGSLAGVWLFSLLSFLEWQPLGWFAVGCAATVPFLLRGQYKLLTATSFAITLAVIALAPSNALWSPYYRIQLKPVTLPYTMGSLPGEAGILLSVNHDYHQKALNLSDRFIAEHPSDLLQVARGAYDLPYRLSAPKSVLVVGAGTGNDVAAALRHGAERVDAVEIDPTIIDIGRRRHPERPYSDPRVTVANDDARSFFKRSTEKYDLIVFGLLDAHTVLSSFSSVRLDSFVYTQESLREAASHLSSGGVISIGFSTAARESDWLGRRIHHMLAAATGRDPIAVRADYDGSTIFVAGPGVAQWAAVDAEIAPNLVDRRMFDAPIEPATDDWPFLYLKSKGLPMVPYGVVLAGLLVVSFVLLRSALRARSGGAEWQMFFLGAGFMLIQVKAISQLSLLFGSTWIVNSVVISAILMMALAANLFVTLRGPSSPLLTYALLGLAILLDFVLPRDLMVSWPLAARTLLGALPAALPLAFAGVIFATGFARSADPARALGWNLLGAVVGGALEYLSMATGLASLGMIAFGLYALSLLAVMLAGHASVRLSPKRAT